MRDQPGTPLERRTGPADAPDALDPDAPADPGVGDASPDEPGDGYLWRDAAPEHSHAYLMPAVEALLAGASRPAVFDLGCGNGAAAARLAALGWGVTGVDPSPSGIAAARRAHPELALEPGSAYDDLAGRHGTFPRVISLEVVEHVYAPRRWARTLFELTEPGGLAVVSTPYHGYLKNLLIAIAGKWDVHHTPLWDHGHIKFWSVATLGRLLVEAGFDPALEWRFVGRTRLVAKSMIVAARRPG